MTITILTASSGIGTGCALAFAESASKINLIARNENDVVELKTSLIKSYPQLNVDIVKFSLGDPFNKTIIDNTDVLIYTIGYLSATQKRNETDDIDILYNVNLTESVKVIENFADSMKKKGKGSLIVVSSVAGERGKISNKIYNSAKAGMSVYLDGLRQELNSQGVHVMTVKPGFVQTKMLGDIKTSPLLTADPLKLGKYVFKAYKSKKAVIYYKPIWRLVMWIIKHIPVGIYKKLKL